MREKISQKISKKDASNSSLLLTIHIGLSKCIVALTQTLVLTTCVCKQVNNLQLQVRANVLHASIHCSILGMATTPIT